MAARWIKAGAVLFLVVMLAGCATKPYRGVEPRNVAFRPAVQSGSFFSSTEAFVDVYAPKPGCRFDFLGTIALDRPTVERGFRTGETSYLVFRFDSSSWLGSSSGSISYETLFTPRKGYRYEALVRYLNGVYGVELTEHGGKRAAPREVEQRLPDCAGR